MGTAGLTQHPAAFAPTDPRLLEVPEGLGGFPAGSRDMGRVSAQQSGFLELDLLAPASPPPSVVRTVRVDGVLVSPRAAGAYAPDPCCIPAFRGDKWARPAHEFTRTGILPIWLPVSRRS